LAQKGIAELTAHQQNALKISCPIG
jgi:hypothetical protein